MRLLALSVIPLLTATVSFALEISPLASPAAPGSMGPALHADARGRVLLSWLEPTGGDGWALKFTRYDAAKAQWSAAREIARGTDWLANWADFPSVTALGDGRLLALWSVNNPAAATAHAGHDHGAGYHAEFSRSDDDGATWSAPRALTAESKATEFATTLPHGEAVLVAWLDGRAHATNGEFQELFARPLSGTTADTRVDPSVCDCCQLSFAAVPGGALLAYRGRTKDEVRDIRLARWRDGAWSQPRPLHDDGWKISACPVNGPRLAAEGARVAAVWFTGAQNDARVQLKLSADGGDTFGDARRLDLGRPSGRVDALWLGDGLGVATWLELTSRDGSRAGGVYLRTFSAEGALGEPRLLVPSGAARAAGFLRLARLDAETLLAAYTVAGEPGRVETLLVRVK